MIMPALTHEPFQHLTLLVCTLFPFHDRFPKQLCLPECIIMPPCNEYTDSSPFSVLLPLPFPLQAAIRCPFLVKYTQYAFAFGATDRAQSTLHLLCGTLSIRSPLSLGPTYTKNGNSIWSLPSLSPLSMHLNFF